MQTLVKHDEPTSQATGADQGESVRLNRPILLLSWSLWLLGAWLAALRYGSFGVAVPLLFQAATAGLLLVWPTYKLSQINTNLSNRSQCLREVLWDWLGLNMVMQVVIWTLHLARDWSWVQTAWLATALAVWSLLAAALTATGLLGRHAGPRLLAMLGCIILLLGEPMVRAVFGSWADRSTADIAWLNINPLETVWLLSQSRGLWTVEPYHQPVLTAAGAALSAWVLLLVGGLFSTRR